MLYALGCQINVNVNIPPSLNRPRHVLSAEQTRRHDVENVAIVANCFEKSRGKKFDMMRCLAPSFAIQNDDRLVVVE